jgi:hypothetical protein
VYSSIFENHGEDTLRFYNLLSAFIFYNLLYVMTHLHQGKKVSILMPGDVNSGPAASR